MSYKILIVDDDKIEREGIRFLISKYHMDLQVFEAKNGHEALEILNEERIDILLTDIQMPIMNGMELVERSRRNQRDLKIIILSAHDDFEYAQKAIGFSVLNYILKPVDMFKFKEVMSMVLQACKDDEERVEKIDMLEEGYNKYRDYKRERYILGLIEGRKSDESDTGQANDMKKTLASDHLLPIMVQFTVAYLKRGKTPFHKLLTTGLSYKFEYVQVNDYEAVIIVRGNYNKARIYSEAENIKKHLEGAGVKSFWGIGYEINHIENLKNVYDSLTEVLNGKFFRVSSKIYVIDQGRSAQLDNEHSESIKGIESDLAKIQTLSETREYEQIRLYIEAIFLKVIDSQEMNPNYIKHTIIEILKSLYKTQNEDDESAFREDMEGVMSAKHITDAKSVLLSVLSKCMENLDVSSQFSNCVQQVLETIHKTYGSSELSVEYLARKVFLTPNYLSNVFKKETGTSINKYVTGYRMDRAKELLINTNIKVVDLSIQVGYTNQSYFCSIFKKYFGVTPAKFRERKGL